MREPLIKLVDIHFSYGDKPLLSGVNLELFPEDKIGITGPNGAGKTTLAEIIMGFITPQKGKLLFKGKELRDERDFYELRTKVGYVFQDPDDQLFCPTVFEDIAFGPLNLGLRGKELEDRVNGILSWLSISHLKDKITYKLSGGEKRIVSIGAVLAMEPEGLILDEPLNGLDERYSLKVESIIKGLNKAIILIAHDFSLLKRVCRRVYKLEGGRLEELHL
ncbi:MAG: energy-coupling factor ABC transporter ATP-binding protein [Synergistetes bacterium]|nr:energy-coupling factor ABC transporter ATP-binding protein [Synergistota bacterium]MDW8191633.1 ABC transporter ATP-binding protein [Synergistota bacterium]